MPCIRAHVSAVRFYVLPISDDLRFVLSSCSTSASRLLYFEHRGTSTSTSTCARVTSRKWLRVAQWPSRILSLPVHWGLCWPGQPVLLPIAPLLCPQIFSPSPLRRVDFPLTEFNVPHRSLNFLIFPCPGLLQFLVYLQAPMFFPSGFLSLGRGRPCLFCPGMCSSR